jgi:hypothetical protein
MNVHDPNNLKRAAADPEMQMAGSMKFETKKVVQKDANGKEITLVDLHFTALVPPYLAEMLNYGIKTLIQAIQETMGKDAVIAPPPGNIEEQKAFHEKTSECIGLPASTLFGHDGKAAN